MSMLNEKATVVVVPRERFRPLIRSLTSLFSTIPREVPVVVVDCGYSEEMRLELLRLQSERPFEIVNHSAFLLPSEARNLAMGHVDTEYVAFCDNDMEYRPGWLEALVANAEQHGAAAVAPLTLIGPSDPPIIHHAGGTFVLERKGESPPHLHHLHLLGNTRMDGRHHEALEALEARGPETDFFEYHCVLVRASARRRIGGDDERLNMNEELDASLRLAADGGIITFEPSSVVLYRAFVPFNEADWPYFLFRWSEEQTQVSDAAFAENWGIEAENNLQGFGFVREHRQRAMFTALPRLPRALNRHRFKRHMLKLYAGNILRHHKVRRIVTDATIPPPPSRAVLDRFANRELA